jgi:hypothetical protein
MSKLLSLLKSRKFWAALAGLVFVVLKAVLPGFPLDEAQLANFLWVLAAYILGVALEDGLTACRSR